jgi:hypothetical protein
MYDAISDDRFGSRVSAFQDRFSVPSAHLFSAWGDRFWGSKAPASEQECYAARKHSFVPASHKPTICVFPARRYRPVLVYWHTGLRTELRT